MTLHRDWKKLLLHAWSVRLIALAAVLSGAEVILPVVGYALPLSDWARALVYFVIVAGAFIARFVAQQRFSAQ